MHPEDHRSKYESAIESSEILRIKINIMAKNYAF